MQFFNTVHSLAFRCFSQAEYESVSDTFGQKLIPSDIAQLLARAENRAREEECPANPPFSLIKNLNCVAQNTVSNWSGQVPAIPCWFSPWFA